MIEWSACPLAAGLLEKYRYHAGHQQCPAMAGGHLMRRKGAGMEFYEFTQYVPGDDIRRIDWEASARTGSEDNWLMRRFAAEEQTTLLISVDLRPTMLLPKLFPKALAALWLAEALAVVGLKGGDRVVLHSLFGEKAPAPVILKSPDRRTLQNGLKRLAAHEDDNWEQFKAFPLQRFLPPASIWVLISDLYFPTEGRNIDRLAQTMCSAQAGLRWLILVDMDTWSFERALLGSGDRRLRGPLGESPMDDPGKVFDITDDYLDDVEAEIKRTKNEFHRKTAFSGRDRTVWTWPEEFLPETFFRERFLSDELLHRIFMRGH